MIVEDCWYKKICHKKCSESCIRFICMRTLFENSRIPEYMWKNKNLECSELDRKAFEQLHAIEDNVEVFVDAGRNVLIHSEICGNGKTSWSVKIMRKYFDKIWHLSGFNCHGLFVNVPQFLYNCKRSISQNVEGFEELCNLISECDLVIWDDVATGDLTSYEHQILLQYIDDRINSGKSNIFTANGNIADLYKKLGDRLSSRIIRNSECIELREEDKRSAV